MMMLNAALLCALSALCAVSALRMPVKQAPKLVLTPTLPTLYVYDHCPFCVRVRIALGLKNIKYNTFFLANDDIATPTALVGKKISPIFSWAEGGIQPMAESLDIVKLVDADPRFGPTNFFLPDTGRTDIAAWEKKVKQTNGLMQRPRYMMGYLPEFASQAGKDAFVKNHPIAPIEKAEWKDDSKWTYEARWAKYVESYAESLTKIDEVNESLATLDKLVFCDKYCSEGGLSYDDINLWARLRSLSIIKGVVWPEKLGSYMQNLSVQGDVPLLDSLAC